MIDGKLETQGRQPSDVQVVIESSGSMALHDEGGEFLVIPAEDTLGDSEDTSPSERDVPSGSTSELETLRTSLQQANEEIIALKAEISSLKMQLCHSKARIKEVWRNSCECLARQDNEIALRDAEIAELKQRLQPAGALSDHIEESFVSTPSVIEPRRRTGRAPPVDPFTGERPDVLLDDWLPSLERAATWNGWTAEEHLLQFAGHLRGKALQEWSLITEAEKENYEGAVAALRARLDPVSLTLAAQDFRHLVQGDDEKVADFIRQVQTSFWTRKHVYRDTQCIVTWSVARWPETRINEGTSGIRCTEFFRIMCSLSE